ncbi:hypothetical protein Nizo2259_1659 [Lactiplantibacillus plantarum]|nr:hypothetical protein Nizo2259_1659 [Lactiplantibacillus plantarum]KZU81402.1 hypothetical protein Nizo2891_0439 [Lactiplantibacillus plantarum]
MSFKVSATSAVKNYERHHVKLGSSCGRSDSFRQQRCDS